MALPARGLSRFAGRELELDEEVLASERATNGRNEAMARLLVGHGRIYFDPDEATDVYTRQGCLLVSAEDLALMGATLADGGVNPVTHRRVVSEDTCRRTLALMLTAGLYERSGEWLYEIGLPGKSGVSGGIVTIAPGQGRPRDVLATTRPGRQQRPRPAGHQAALRGARPRHPGLAPGDGVPLGAPLVNPGLDGNRPYAVGVVAFPAPAS